MITITGMQQQMADIEKRRRKHREPPAEPCLTPAHEADAAALTAQCAPPGHCDSKSAEAAAKARAAMPHASGPGSGEPGPENARGAYPGPGDFGRPDGIDPGEFTRGYLGQGHSAPSPQSGPPCDFPVPKGQPAPGDFGRRYIAPGHAAQSPANTGTTRQHPPGLAQVHGSGPIAAQVAAWRAAGLVMPSPAPGAAQ